MNPDVHDNLRYLGRLFPKWAANDETLALWLRKLSPFNQQAVKHAIEQERISAARMSTPNLDAVLKRLGSSSAGAKQADPKYSWKARFDRQPEALKPVIQAYCRILDAATPAQKHTIMQRFGDEFCLAEQDWLNIADRLKQRVLMDKWLPGLVSELIDKILAPSEVDEAMRKRAGAIIDRVAKAMKLDRGKRFTADEIEEIGRELTKARAS